MGMGNLGNTIILRASALPEIHKDPADRFIIATALLNGFVIVTGDRRSPEYGIETLHQGGIGFVVDLKFERAFEWSVAPFGGRKMI